MTKKTIQCSIEYIDSEAQLQSICEVLFQEKIIAVDTEFHRVNTYFPRLCLIQIASSSRVFCIDPFKIKVFSALMEVFKDSNIIKVFHSCKQDIEVLYQGFDCIPSPIFDTQVAVDCLGLGHQVGYANLVKERLDVHLEKSQTRTDWTRRPLKAAQLQYAAEDVVSLRELYLPLREQLDTANRCGDYNAKMTVLLDETQYKTDALMGPKKIRGIRRLKGTTKKMAQALAVWREQQAINENQPRQWIIKDQPLLELVKNYAPSQSDEDNLCWLSDGLKKKYGEVLLTTMASVKDT